MSAPEDLPTTVPALLTTIWRDALATVGELEAALADVGLPTLTRGEPPRVELEVPLDGVEDVDALLKRVRLACSRAVGKAVGSDKHWDLGSYDAGVCVARGSLWVSLHAKVSLEQVRAAAADFLAGADGVPWLLAHGFADAGAERKETGFWPRPAGLVHSTSARLFDDGRVRAHFFLDPGARPPGVSTRSDDEGYAASLAHLAEVLGERDDPRPSARPVWTRGGRRFTFYRMSSRSRSVLYEELVTP
ncbi:hypothetical protein [Litorihabitans aurantiacus]|uniref:hypothetical protein n=1 Tax=Litorihabitans aurantiacus TaxID=1930061 RepID=UPI0024E099ED|nr:hypothetical protein [Litorihabitans aurantiacus]